MNNLRFIFLLLVSSYCFIATSCDPYEDCGIDRKSESLSEDLSNEVVLFQFKETCQDSSIIDTLGLNTLTYEFSEDSILTFKVYENDGPILFEYDVDLKIEKENLKRIYANNYEELSTYFIEYCRDNYADSIKIDSNYCERFAEEQLGFLSLDTSLNTLVHSATDFLLPELANVTIERDTTIVYYDIEENKFLCPVSEIRTVNAIGGASRLPVHSIDNLIGPDTRAYKLPLSPNDTQTTFTFRSAERSDTIVFKYRIREEFISPECGLHLYFEELEVTQCTFEKWTFDHERQLLEASWK